MMHHEKDEWDIISSAFSGWFFSATKRWTNICLPLFDIDFIQSTQPANDVFIYSWSPFHGQIMSISSFVSDPRIHSVRPFSLFHSAIETFWQKIDFDYFFLKEICLKYFCRELLYDLSHYGLGWWRIDEIEWTMAESNTWDLLIDFDSKRYVQDASKSMVKIWIWINTTGSNV